MQCYDPVKETWRIHSYINDPRNFLGVTESQSGVHIFGGYSWSKGALCDTAERLSEDGNWGYIPNPFWNLEYNNQSYVTKAVTFYPIKKSTWRARRFSPEVRSELYKQK